MAMTLNIENMTFEEKIMAMEALWDDLAKHNSSKIIPAWHETVLAERQAKMERGETDFSDWKEVKSRLDKLSNGFSSVRKLSKI